MVRLGHVLACFCPRLVRALGCCRVLLRADSKNPPVAPDTRNVGVNPRGHVARRVTCTMNLQSKSDVVIVVALLAVAAVPRLINLVALDPYIDEVIWLYWSTVLFNSPASTDFCGTLYACPQVFIGPMQLDIRRYSVFWLPLALDGRPPLFFWLTLLTEKAVDNVFVGGRLAAAIPSIGCTVLLYILGRLLLSRSVGVLAAALWAFSPFSIFFGRNASDDALLTFFIMLSAIMSILMVKYPGRSIAIYCGLAMGLAILSKTLGLVTIAFPLLAVLCYGKRKTFGTLLLQYVFAVLTVIVLMLTIMMWSERLLAQTANFAQITEEQNSFPVTGERSFIAIVVNRLISVIHTDLLYTNSRVAWSYLRNYIGEAPIFLAVLSIPYFAFRSWRSMSFSIGASFLMSFALLNFSRFLYSRYLLFASVFIYIFAALGIVGIADILFRGSQLIGVLRMRSRLIGIGAAFVITSVVVLSNAAYIYALVTTPQTAPLPAFDHDQYIEQWYAMYGLGQAADFIRRESQEGGAIILTPVRSYSWQVLVPYEALRMYMRGDENIQFVETQAFQNPGSLCDLRRWQNSQAPVFFIINGTHRGGIQEFRGQAASYTRRLEVALARDVPGSGLVLHVRRPSGRNWLSVYRLDMSGPSLESTGGIVQGDKDCVAPSEWFGDGWSKIQQEPGALVPYREMESGAVFRQGPLSQGSYRTIIWARSETIPVTVSVSVNGVNLGSTVLPAGEAWTWLESERVSAIDEGGFANVEVRFQPDDDANPRARPGASERQTVMVRQIDLLRSR
jgi:hypothetical protein